MGVGMALFLEVHKVGGRTAEEVARGHAADLVSLERLGIRYRRHWLSPGSERVFCLVEATDAESLRAAQRDGATVSIREVTGLFPMDMGSREGQGSSTRRDPPFCILP